MDWLDVNKELPKKGGQYEVKTEYDEGVAFYARTFGGEYIWLLPLDIVVTHWRKKQK